MSYYIHNVPGRLRIKSPELKYKPKQCTDIQEKLACIEGVDQVKVNPTTGSATVMYDKEKLSATNVLNILEQEKIVDTSKITLKDPFVMSITSEAGEKAAKAILGYAVEQVFKANGLSLLAALI